MSDVLGRRTFLAGAAALAAGACSGRGDGGGADADLDLAREAAGMEKLAVDHYTATGMLATGGKLGALIPPAFAALVAAAAGQHRQAHDAWNALLAGAGRPPVTAPGAKLQEALNAAGVRIADIPGAAALALRVEDFATQTYQRALPALIRPEALTLAARVSVVGHQRQAVLRYLLGLDPVTGARAEPTLRLITG